MTRAETEDLDARYDMLIRGGVVVTPDSAVRRDVAVRDGRVAVVAEPGTVLRAHRVVDATGRYILPGLIDAHVHFRTPGLTHKEDWAHGSRAAAAGGVTTVLDMPNTVPPLFTPEDLEKKATEVAGTSLVDYGFHAGVDPRRPALVREFADAGVASVKAFLTGHHTAPHFLRGPDALRDFFAEVAGTGLLALFHAECAEVFELLDSWRGEPSAWRDYERHRPRTGAIVAVSRLIELCRDTGTPIHVLHVSTREEADLLTAAGAAGLPATFEVTGHHLTFTAADTAALGARIRLSPAIREPADRDRLWEAIRYGHARTVGSDHAPHELADKLRPPAQAPPGLPGVQELLPALFTGLRLRDPGADPGELLRLVTTVLGVAPAALFGLGHRKGRIEAGLDADLVLFDADATWTLAEAEIRSRCGWSAYQGRTFIGRVTTTLRRGEMVYQCTPETTVFGTPSGEWIRPRPARA